MKTIDRRIRKLERRCGAADGQGHLLVVCRADCELALDQDTCIEILRECGFLPVSFRGFAVVNLCDIPDGLSAAETERFLRESGAELCPSGVPNHGSAGENPAR